MKVGESEAKLLDNLEPSIVGAYLQRTGWSKQSSGDPNATIWAKWNATEGREYELLLPSHKRLGDYILRLAEAVEVLSRFEERPAFDVIRDVEAEGRYGGLLIVKAGLSLADGLVKLWGLDVFGLSGLKRRTIEELRSAAATVSVLFLFDLILWPLLFVMVLESRLMPLALALGIVFSISNNVFRRNLFIAGFSAKGTRRLARVLLHFLFTILTASVVVPPVTLLMFRVPIDNKIAEFERAGHQELGSHNFLNRLRVLNILLRQENETGRLFRVTYGFTVAVVYITSLMPLAFPFLSSGELEVYYSPASAKRSEQAPNPGPQADT